MLMRSIAQARLKQQRAIATINPVFRGAALQLQSVDAFEVIISGPAETGKTFAVCWYLDSFLRRYKGAVGLLCRKTRESLYTTVLRTYGKLIAEFGDVRTFGGERPLWYDYPNGSRLYLAGLDNPGKVLSGEFDIIVSVQTEELTLGDWETLTTRATGRAANAPTSIVLGDCNPSGARHWILHREGLQLLRSTHRDNPTLYDEAGVLTVRGARSLGVLARLTGARHARLMLGLWQTPEGAVYVGFDADVHTCDWFPIPREWPRYRVIDFGFVNPFVCLWVTIDPDGVIIVYRELYVTQTLVDDAAHEINQLSEGEHIIATIADHDAGDRATLARNGIDTVAAYKAVAVGIQAVQQRLVLDGGKPRLLFMRNALVRVDPLLEETRQPTSVVDEIDGYVWAKTREGNDTRNAHEEPVKKDDHGLDALRYIVAYIDSIDQELYDTEALIIVDDPVSISPM